MSWSKSLIGKPENIIKALKEESLRLKDASKEEFDKALPSMIALLELNYNDMGTPNLRFMANGHASEGPLSKYSSMNIKIEYISETIV